MAIVDADYSTYINLLRGHLAKGTAPSAYDQKRLIALIQDAVARLTTANAVNVALAEVADIDAQVAILVLLDAAACAANAGADAAAVIATACTAITTATVAIAAATPAEPTYTTATLADG